MRTVDEEQEVPLLGAVVRVRNPSSRLDAQRLVLHLVRDQLLPDRLAKDGTDDIERRRAGHS